jgi:hypothetical protein
MNPAPVYRSVKDLRNSPLWNPSSLKLRNVEDDDAGKLAAFRAKFGRGWDADSTDAPKEESKEIEEGEVSIPHALLPQLTLSQKKKVETAKSGMDSLMDLISNAGASQIGDKSLRGGGKETASSKKKK